MRSEVEAPRLDSLKLAASIAVLIAAIFGYYYYADVSVLLRVLGLLASVAVAVAITMTTMLGRGTWSFFKSSRTEVRKVVWPTRAETMQTTLAVIVVVILMAIMLWLVDMFLGWGVSELVG